MTPGQKNCVSFFTCCYEADWEFFLKEGRLKEMIGRCNYPFASRNLIINNVNDRDKVIQYAELAIKDGIIDNYFFSEEFIAQALLKYHIKRRNFKLDGYDGYWYSVGPFTALFVCKTDYLLYFTGDCMMQQAYEPGWINKGINKLAKSNIFCVTPLWNYLTPRETFDYEEDDCYYDKGFTDQTFLIKTESFSAINFNEYHVRSEIFPIYGGNHFERRVFCYMNNRNYKRCVFKNFIFIHEKLMKPGYKSPGKRNRIGNEIKYIIAKAKRKFRKKNILVKFLLR